MSSIVRNLILISDLPFHPPFSLVFLTTLLYILPSEASGSSEKYHKKKHFCPINSGLLYEVWSLVSGGRIHSHF